MHMHLHTLHIVWCVLCTPLSLYLSLPCLLARAAQISIDNFFNVCPLLQTNFSVSRAYRGLCARIFTEVAKSCWQRGRLQLTAVDFDCPFNIVEEEKNLLTGHETCARFSKGWMSWGKALNIHLACSQGYWRHTLDGYIQYMLRSNRTPHSWSHLQTTKPTDQFWQEILH